MKGLLRHQLRLSHGTAGIFSKQQRFGGPMCTSRHHRLRKLLRIENLKILLITLGNDLILKTHPKIFNGKF